MSPLLIQLILALAPYGVEVVNALIPVITGIFAQSPETVSDMLKTITGSVNASHPDWTQEERNSYIQSTLTIWIKESN